jgi:hypothetical protein
MPRMRKTRKYIRVPGGKRPVKGAIGFSKRLSALS